MLVEFDHQRLARDVLQKLSESGLSMQGLAARTGIPYTSLNRFLMGKTTKQVNICLSLVVFFAIPLKRYTSIEVSNHGN